MSAESSEGPYDDLVRRLHARRVEAGNPSFSEIAGRVARIRTERGGSEFEARVARTTIYDMFRLGRRRLDWGLLSDIVRALGADEAEVATWHEQLRLTPPDGIGRLEVAGRDAGGSPGVAPDGDLAPRADGEPGADAQEPVPVPSVPSSRMALATVCVVVNLVGLGIATVLELPLYLDMIGTAVAAIVLGPWWGAGVGLATNIGAVSFVGWQSLPFAAVNIAGALVWGYGVHRFGMGRTISRFFLLNVMVALTCTAIAAPLLLVLFEGYTGGAPDEVARTMLAAGDSLVAAVVSGNLFTSLADKLIAGFAALMILESYLGRAAGVEQTSLGRRGGDRPLGRIVA